MAAISSCAVAISTMIEWNENMSVGIDEFDTHHRRIIDLINRLDASVNTGDARRVTEEALAELSNYCIYHFFAEEDAMERCNFPGCDEHKNEHLAFTDKIFQLVGDMHTGTADVSRELLDLLWNWLSKHILITDKKYSAAIRAGGMA